MSIPTFKKELNLKTISEFVSNYKWLIIILSFFTIIYSLISIVNHYLFRTYAWDLGIYNHGIYQYSHFQLHKTTLNGDGITRLHLGDHFSPIIMLLSPLAYLFKSYTLLIVQIGFVLFGSIGIYKLANYELSNKLNAHLITIHFLLFFGITSALAFDFHANVLASMLVPWFILSYRKNKTHTYLFFALILICKENMALWMIFIVLGLMVHEMVIKKTKKNLTLLSALFVISIIYFVLIQSVVMPAVFPEKSHLSHYSHLGESYGEILKTLFEDARKTFALIFENHTNDPSMYGIKSETIFMLLVSGGIAFFYKPVYAIMIIPLLAQKFLTNGGIYWSINAHYSIEFIPIISLAIIDIVKSKEIIKSKRILIAFICFSLYFHIDSINHRNSKYSLDRNISFYKKEHYKTGYNIKELHKTLNKIPDDAIVSCSSNLVPRLAFREKIYHFPIIKDAEFLVLTKDQYYPLNKEKFESKVSALRNSDSYKIFKENKDIIIFKALKQ